MKITPKKSDVGRMKKKQLTLQITITIVCKWLMRLIDYYRRNNNLFLILTYST
jgi:hypothetical protein